MNNSLPGTMMSVVHLVWIPVALVAVFVFLAAQLPDHEGTVLLVGLLVLIAYYLHALWTAIWFEKVRHAIENRFDPIIKE